MPEISKNIETAISLLMISALAGIMLSACGEMPAAETKKSAESSSSSQASPTPSPSAQPLLDFNLHVNPALKSACGGAICHGAGSSYGVYLDREDLFLAAGPKVLDRLATTDTKKVMPKYGFPVQLKSTEKTNIVNYLKEHGISAAAPVGSGTPGNGTGTSSSSPSPTPSPGFTQPPAAKLCAKVTAEEKTAGLAMTFAQVTEIFTPNCGGGGCHSGTPLPRGFVGQESSLQDRIYSAGIVLDIQNGSMPKGRSMTENDKKAAIAYLCARHDF